MAIELNVNTASLQNDAVREAKTDMKNLGIADPSSAQDQKALTEYAETLLKDGVYKLMKFAAAMTEADINGNRRLIKMVGTDVASEMLKVHARLMRERQN